MVSWYVHDREIEARRDRDATVFGCDATGISALLSNGLPIGVLRGCDMATNFVQLAQRLGQVEGVSGL